MSHPHPEPPLDVIHPQPLTPTQEERPGDNVGGSAPLQLLLPDLRFDVARALLEFIYTGELRRSLDLDSPLPYDLRAAAKSYGILRLEALCTEAIALGSDPGLGANSKEDWGQVSNSGCGARGWLEGARCSQRLVAIFLSIW